MSSIPVSPLNATSNGQTSLPPQEISGGHPQLDGPPMVRINPLLSPTFISPSGETGIPLAHNLFFHGSDVRPPRNRKPNYSENEKQIFFALISPHVDLLDAKSQERQIMTMKTEIWKEITHKYNGIISKLSGNYVCRDAEELKTFWKNVRRSNRRKFVEGHVPDLSERMGMDGPPTPNKLEGASSYLTCSPLLSAMPGIQEDLMSAAGPSSSSQDPLEGDAVHPEYDQDEMIDVKAEPVFNVSSEICDDENSQNNTQSSSDRPPSQSSPTSGMTGPYLLKKETHCTTILDQLLRDDTFSDVTLTAEGQSIRAHKIVLCLASAYFRQVLSKESTVQNVIVFRDIKFSELKNLINFIYTGEATVDAAELESFMRTAEMLEVNSLCEGQRNLPKNFLPRNRETEQERPKSTSSSSSSSKRSLNASANSPPAKSRKMSDASPPPKTPKTVSHPSTSSGGAVPMTPVAAPVIKSEPLADDLAMDDEYEGRDDNDDPYDSHAKSPCHYQEPDKSPPLERISDSSSEKVPPGKCPYCPSSQQPRKGAALTKHLHLCHPEKTAFCCDNCSRVFLKKGSFEAHKDDCNR